MKVVALQTTTTNSEVIAHKGSRFSRHLWTCIQCPYEVGFNLGGYECVLGAIIAVYTPLKLGPINLLNARIRTTIAVNVVIIVRMPTQNYCSKSFVLIYHHD